MNPCHENYLKGDPRFASSGRGDIGDTVERKGVGSNALADQRAEYVDSGFIAVDDDTASITFTVEVGRDGIRLTLESYVKPGPRFDRAHVQVEFERTTGRAIPASVRTSAGHPRKVF